MNKSILTKIIVSFLFRDITSRIILIISLFIYNNIYSQEQYNSIANIIPPSPEAAALGKYGEYPVSNYTGIPNINVPLWQINTNKLQLPVKLSYHASGIRVEEIATNVGLGWSLNAGGIITRSVRNLPDDCENGYYGNPIKESELGDIELIRSIVRRLRDGEPDIFYYNFGKHSGSFFFNDDTTNQQVILSSKEQIKIEITHEPDGFREFTITTPNGDKYFFGDISTEDNFYREYTQVGPSPPSFYYSSWLLRKIVAFDNTDTIHFYYDNFGSSEYIETITESVELSSQNLTVKDYKTNETQTKNIFQKRIDSISFSMGKIEFIYFNDRLDLDLSQSLDTIKIINNYNEVIKNHILYYSEFQSEQGSGIESKRLKLDSIKEQSPNGELKPPYIFNYYTEKNLPPRKVAIGYYDQDHWGYYNGAGNDAEATFIPTFTFYGKMFKKADREPRWPFTKANILEKIIFPTGGFTEFIFEPNYIGMSGPDTLVGYYESEEIYENIFQCDDMWSIILSEEFEIHAGHNLIKLGLGVQHSDYCTDNTIGAGISVLIEETGGSGANKTFAVTLEDEETERIENFFDSLAPGNYNLQITLHKNSEFWYSFQYDKYIDDTIIVQRDFEQFGGIRISKIINSPGDDLPNIVKEYKYEYQSDNRYSSGIITNKPMYHRAIGVKFYHNTYIPSGGIFTGRNVCTLHEWGLIELSAFSNIPLGTTQGGIVGYEEVTVKELGGSVTYKYSTPNDYKDNESFYYQTGMYNGSDYVETQLFPPKYEYGYPYPPAGNMDWARGKVTEKIIRDDDNIIQLIEEYDYDLTHDSSFAIKAVPYFIVNDPILNDQYANIYVKYYNISGWNPLTNVNTTHYDNGEPGYTITKNYEYNGNGHLFITKDSTKNSNGDSYETTYKYPLDITDPSEAFISSNVLNKMIDNYMVDKVLIKEIEHNSNLIKGEITSYDSFNGNEDQIYQKSIRVLEDENYSKKLNYEKYDDYGNIIQYNKENDIHTSFIWGYNNTLPIAKCINSVSSEIGYSSFENFEGNGWSHENLIINYNDTHTGEAVVRVANEGSEFGPTHVFPIDEGSEPNRGYKLSVWSKSEQANSAYLHIEIEDLWSTHKREYNSGSGQLELLEVELTVDEIEPYLGTGKNVKAYIGNSSITPAYFDDLCFLPSDAQMETYTYDLLIGMTSAERLSNITDYFEYDNFGRLQYTYDDQKYIKEKFSYNYKKYLYTSPSSVTFPYSGETKTINIVSNYTDQYQILESEDWFSVTPTQGAITSFEVICDQNNSIDPRFGEIQINGTELNTICQVSQEGLKYLDVTPSSIDLDNSSGSVIIDINSNINWSAFATPNTDWLSIESPNWGKNDGILTLFYFTNETTSDRLTEISVSGSGLSETISITQTAGDSIVVDPSNVEIPSSGNGQYNITINSSVDWTISEIDNEDFFHCSAYSGSSGESVIQVIGDQKNNNDPGGSTWEGWLYVEGSGISFEVYIEQWHHD